MKQVSPGGQLLRSSVCLIIVGLMLSALPCQAGESGSGVLTLSEGIRIATDQNRLVRMAKFEREGAFADTLVARSRLLPTVSGSVSQTFLAYRPGVFINSTAVPTADRSSFAFGLSVHQTIYDFGANRSVYDASQASLQAREIDIARIRNLVALDFIIAYCDLLEAEKMVTVVQRECEALESHLAVARSLYEEGAITKNDLLQAEVRLSDAKQRLLTQSNLRHLTASRINTILARPLAEKVMVQDISGDVKQDADLEGAWAAAEQQRTELGIIDRELRIVDLQETAKKAEFYPNIFGEGGYSFIENPFQVNEDNWSLVFGLNVSLYSGGRTKAEVMKLRYRREQLQEER
ncbi:MAG TPA: TolC family protein, partial [Dissulfurispiraceae bacterium]|nr:TolC family protein [Dissulfurispiraceae bacterium]